MSVEAVALVVAAIGFMGSFVTSLVTSRASRRNAFVQELRTRTAEAFKHVFLVLHAIEWVTWNASYDPEAITDTTKAEYDSEVHGAFPPLLAAMAAVAGLSTELYERLEPILQTLYSLDERVALAMRGYTDSIDARNAALERLSDMYLEVHRLHASLMREIAESMRAAVESRAAY